MSPKYNFEKIRFSTDPESFKKAVKLYEGKKIIDFKEEFDDYSAIVLGTKPYKVFVSGRNQDMGSCECYLGQNNFLCKHMTAVAIYACLKGEKINEEDKKVTDEPISSGNLGELNKEDLTNIKKVISGAVKYIKPYKGPSKIWFAYQSSLSEGCARLSNTVSKLPVSEQTAELLTNLLLRLDKKLCNGGVDDSDGTVGNFISSVVNILIKYSEFDARCINTFKKLCDQSTCFGWEEPLVKIFDEREINI